VRQFSDGVFDFNLRLENDPTPEEMATAIQRTWDSGYDDVAIVGFGEPLLNLEATIAAIQAVKELADVPVRMDTNGQGLIIHPERNLVRELAEAGLDRVQISLNAQDSETYLRLCRPKFGRGTYESILDFAERCKEHMTVELSAVDIPGVDIDACRGIAERLGVRFRVRIFKGPEGALDGILRTMSE
jgi:TatD family-associated radical SAM protein